jgi:hypothetical protein
VVSRSSGCLSLWADIGAPLLRLHRGKPSLDYRQAMPQARKIPV